jgi:hypothetical protein
MARREGALVIRPASRTQHRPSRGQAVAVRCARQIYSLAACLDVSFFQVNEVKELTRHHDPTRNAGPSAVTASGRASLSAAWFAASWALSLPRRSPRHCWERTPACGCPVSSRRKSWTLVRGGWSPNAPDKVEKRNTFFFDVPSCTLRLIVRSLRAYLLLVLLLTHHTSLSQRSRSRTSLRRSRSSTLPSTTFRRSLRRAIPL